MTGFAGSVATEPPRQLDVELLEVDVAHALKELGGPGVSQEFRQPVARSRIPGNTARRHDRATETADPKEAGRLADTTPGARRRSGDREDRAPQGDAPGVAAWYSAFDGDPKPPRPAGRPPPGYGPPLPRARTAPSRIERPMTGPAVVSIARIDPELARRSWGRVQRLVAGDGPGNVSENLRCFIAVFGHGDGLPETIERVRRVLAAGTPDHLRPHIAVQTALSSGPQRRHARHLVLELALRAQHPQRGGRTESASGTSTHSSLPSQPHR